jgi:H+/gluconate symporter-like permease
MELSIIGIILSLALIMFLALRGWHLFGIPYAFGIGSITMTMLPGSPQILNIMPTKYMASTPMAAPLIGILAALVVAAFNVFYFKYQLKKSKERGEVYEAPTGVGVIGTADVDLTTLPNVWLSIVPMVVVVVLLNVLKLDAVWSLAGGTSICMVFFWNKYKNILDTLPHNGVVITFLAVCGLTHVNAYKHVFFGHSVATVIALLIVISLGILLY